LTSDPSKSWVDLRFIEARFPGFAQPLGGAITLSTQLLSIPRGELGLIRVQGELIAASGAVVAENTGTYRWVPLHGTTQVRCVGICAVAATGRLPAKLPLDPPERRLYPIAFRQPFPWLAVARLGARIPGFDFLRYNVRYDGAWTALLGNRILPHVRVDGVTNGWLLPQDDTRSVLIVHGVAALQFLAECAGMSVIIGLLALNVTGILRPALEEAQIPGASKMEGT